MLQVMTLESAKAGDAVIRQGDEGDKFYVVDSGTYAVSVSDDPKKVGRCMKQYLDTFDSSPPHMIDEPPP